MKSLALFLAAPLEIYFVCGILSNWLSIIYTAHKKSRVIQFDLISFLAAGACPFIFLLAGMQDYLERSKRQTSEKGIKMSNLFISMKMFWVCEITRLGGRIAHGSFGWHDVPACVCCDADKWSYEAASAIWMVIIAVPLYFVHPLASAVPGVICVVKIYNVTLKRVFKSMGV